MGSLTIASPTFSYRTTIEPGGNGWLAAAHEWDRVLSGVLRDVDAARVEVAPRARAEARERFGWDRQAATIEAALFG